MNIEIIREGLLWGILINFALLMGWFVLFAMAHDWIHRLHGRWFILTREQFDAIHYSAMALYKLCIVFFLIVPCLVLWILF